MIDFEKTIYKNEIDKINLLRYQAKDDIKGFKSILSLIILLDMIEWSEYLDTPHHIVKKLVDKRSNFVLHNSCITTEYTNDSDIYVNVNTPQSNDTWKRIWDCEYVTTASRYLTPIKFIELVDIDSSSVQNNN